MNDIINENDQDIINMLFYKYNNDKNYHKNIENKYNNNWQKLTWYELYILEELTNYGHKNYISQLEKNLEYDNYVELKYSNEEEIKNSLLNIFIGNSINKMLELNHNAKIEKIKNRQKKPGMIANIDKPYIINMLTNELKKYDIETIINNTYDNIKNVNLEPDSILKTYIDKY